MGACLGTGAEQEREGERDYRTQGNSEDEEEVYYLDYRGKSFMTIYICQIL